MSVAFLPASQWMGAFLCGTSSWPWLGGVGGYCAACICCVSVWQLILACASLAGEWVGGASIMEVSDGHCEGLRLDRNDTLTNGVERVMQYAGLAARQQLQITNGVVGGSWRHVLCD